MPKPVCSKCGNLIPESDINVAKDVAYCRACNLAEKLSALARDADPIPAANLENPPAGAWCRNDAGQVVIGGTHRSLVIAVATFFPAVFWNGIVSVFVMVALSSTLHLTHIPVPEWFPASKMIAEDMRSGMTWFLWLFLTPFIAVGLMLFGSFLSALGGRTEVTVGPSEGRVFVGIGAIGWKKRFNPRAIKAVRLVEKNWRDSEGDSQHQTYILIETQEGAEIKFGTMLKPERKKFVAAALRKTLMM